MTHSVLLGEKYIQESPKYFQNFLRSIPNEWSAEGVNQALTPYHAEYVIRKGEGVILEFNSEQDFTLFLLRWS
jgi:hypothetical protein